MNISPDSSPQNSGSESGRMEMKAIYGNRRYKSRNHRNWNSNNNQSYNSKWQNRSGYSNRDSYQKSKYENSWKNKYESGSNNKTPYGKYSKEEVADLVSNHYQTHNATTDFEGCQWGQITKKQGRYYIYHQVRLTSKHIQTQVLHLRHWIQPNKFTEIYDVISGREDGTTFKISIQNQKFYALFDTGVEISVMNSTAFEKLKSFWKTSWFEAQVVRAWTQKESDNQVWN